MKSRFPALAWPGAPDPFVRHVALAVVACAIIDGLLCNVLIGMGFELPAAHTTAFVVTLVEAGGLTMAVGGWTCGRRKPLRVAVVAMLAYLVRATLVTGLADKAGWSSETAVAPGVVMTALFGLLGASLLRVPSDAAAFRFGRDALAICVICYGLLLRFIFAGSMDLLPEESYYWAYAQDLDVGYLDHPPMVAWLIWLGTRIVGHDELGVRLPALGCWIVAAAFLFRLARNLYDRRTAVQVLLLVSVLPIYFSVGLVMTPDAPLYCAWAGGLYFLERALIGRRRWAWLGVGACLGLGTLSKYTIALLGPAVLVYLILDGKSREWLRRPEPYVGAGLAILVFSPVILWNASHHWASFVFQGPERWAGPVEFSLPLLVGEVLLLLTPLGLLGVAAAFGSRWSASTAGGEDSRKRFALVFTLAPLAVFLLYSLHGQPKLNWTGPVWLAALPLLAWHITHAGLPGHTLPWSPFGRRLWCTTAIVCLITYGGCLHYIQLGLPGLSLTGSMSVPVAWKEMAREIQEIDRRLEIETGQEPLVVGMDKYFIASQFAFYDPDNDGFEETSGRHLFGGASLMWAYWHPASAARGNNLLLIAFTPDRLSHQSISCRFRYLGPVTRHAVTKHGNVAIHFYARVGYAYDPVGVGCS